jgi:hypothetical protein
MMIPAKEEYPLRLQSPKLIVEELPDELMIVDPERNKAFCLNRTASFVWKQADGKTSVAEITRRLARHLDEPADEEVVWFTLDVLLKDGLLNSDPVQPPAALGVTRRHLLQKMGVGAMALPVVTVLMVSPAKAHASSAPPTETQNIPQAVSQQPPGGFWKWLEDLF